jgi:hypothetical protein
MAVAAGLIAGVVVAGVAMLLALAFFLWACCGALRAIPQQAADDLAAAAAKKTKVTKASKGTAPADIRKERLNSWHESSFGAQEQPALLPQQRCGGVAGWGFARKACYQTSHLTSMLGQVGLWRARGA